jgi:RNA polymerase sigma-70 factor (ECF subfamily)
MAEGQILDEGTDFEEHRRYLSAVAYRLLGSLADAEDAVQDAWLRWRSADRSAVRDPRAFLTTVVTRICYDQLGSARARREAYYGEWLPEPLLGPGIGGVVGGAGGSGAGVQDPQELAALGESVSYAVLAVMEQLSPAERVAFVLHDVFAVGFEEIAEALGRTPESARQLASRGRRRVRERTAQRTVDRAEHLKAVKAFAAATVNGDIPGLMAVLHPDVVWHSDGGGVVRAGLRPVVTADRVARLVAGLSRYFGPETSPAFVPAEVNGAPGLVLLDGDGAAMGVVTFEVADGRITEAYAVVNPEKLARVAGGAVSPHLPRR